MLQPDLHATPSALAPLARDAGSTLAEQLAARYVERIAQRLLAPGTRLPSVREGARRHGVSPSTVVAAYEQLLARGLIEAKAQRGFFVRQQRAARAPSTLSTPSAPSGSAGAAAHADALPPVPVDATALIRGMFLQGPSAAGPGLGTLPPDWLDLPVLQAALRRALQQGQGRHALAYGEPAGNRALREALAPRLADLGVLAEPRQIVTTVGATQALDLVSRTLLRPGDAVLVDDPGWAVEYARLSQMGMRLLPVPRGPQGPDLAVMQALCEAHQPRMYTTVSVLHNPTGYALSATAAHQVLKLAERHDFHIVEDDTYAWLAPPHLPRLAALDGLQRTVYVGGVSKILAPGWRVGYLAAPQALVERLVDTKLLSTLTTPALLEHAVAQCLEQGQLRRHAERVVQRLASARQRCVRLAEEAGCRFVAPPAGLFGWVDAGTDTDRLSHTLLDAGWLLAPGSLFHAAHRPGSRMRINFATAQDARFWQDFRRATAQAARPAGR
jgi:DNA-binding transcriptional MocR family regulator